MKTKISRNTVIQHQSRKKKCHGNKIIMIEKKVYIAVITNQDWKKIKRETEKVYKLLCNIMAEGFCFYISCFWVYLGWEPFA